MPQTDHIINLQVPEFEKLDDDVKNISIYVKKNWALFQTFCSPILLIKINFAPLVACIMKLC